MIKYLMSKSVIERALIGLLFCIIVFCFGFFFVLNYVSTMEDPPLGNTIYILIGSTLSVIPILGVIVILKYLYDHKKKQERRQRKRKKHPLFYLNDLKKLAKDPPKDKKVE